MALSQEDLEQVGAYVQTHLIDWLPKNVVDLSERITRAEEEFVRLEKRLDSQYSLIKEGFERMDKRFEDLRTEMDKRFAEQRAETDRRFEEVDKRFAEQRAETNARFEQMDKRFDAMHRHTTRWMTALMVVLGLMSVAVTVTNLIS
jgi:DNA anti-recombination protein RmuC